jgi:restriction system protein
VHHCLVKLKMAEKSLFAILLRSPWWVSLCIVFVFVVASKMLLPEAWAPFGALGSFPFVVIALMAGWRQFKAPNAQHVEQTLQQAAQMSWKEFSAAVEQALVAQGYAVTRLPQTQGQGAADFKLEKSGRIELLAAKRWKAANQGIEPLRDLVKLRDAMRADLCRFVSLGALTDQAQRFATAHQVELMTSGSLFQMLGGKK